MENFSTKLIESFQIPELALGAAVISVAIDDYRAKYAELNKIKRIIATYPDFRFDKAKVKNHHGAYVMLEDAKNNINIRSMLSNIVKNDCNVRLKDPEYADELQRFAAWARGIQKFYRRQKKIESEIDDLVEFFHDKRFSLFSLVDGNIIYEQLIKEMKGQVA